MDLVEERVPCVDDMCTGILDAKGVCGTCGRVGDLSVIERAANEDAAGTDAAESDELTAAEPSEPEPAAASEPAADEAIDPDERVPCSDEMCTGIIGADGRCGTCGKAAS